MRVFDPGNGGDARSDGEASTFPPQQPSESFAPTVESRGVDFATIPGLIPVGPPTFSASVPSAFRPGMVGKGRVEEDRQDVEHIGSSGNMIQR